MITSIAKTLSQPIDILFLSHSPDDGTFKVGSHHLAREFSRSGLRVVHLSTQRSVIHRLRSVAGGSRASTRGLWTDEHGTVHFVPTSILPAQWTPTSYPTLVERVYDSMMPEFVLVDQPLMAGLPRKYFPEAKIVYRPTDTYSKGVAASRQKQVLNQASGIVATSFPVYDALDADPSLPYKVVENGVELNRFSSVEAHDRQGFVYVGALDYRFDWESIKILAERYPYERIDLYGPLSGPHPNLPSNARLHGAVSYNHVPRILNQYRVGLIPLGPADVNAGRSPMKYFEYLAAGLYVVATATPALIGRDIPGVFLYSDGASAVAAARKALSSSYHNAPGIEAAALEDWGEKSKQILKFLRRL